MGREVDFYRELAPDVGLRTPRMHNGSYDPASHGYVLLLQDMAPAPVGDSMTGYPADDAEALVRQLARLHARWWNDASLADFDWLTTLGERAEQWQRTAVRAWERASAAPGDAVDAEAAAAIQAMIEHWPRIAEYLSRPPFTLVHGDFKPDNLCFPNGPLGEVIALDWQNSQRGRGPTDLAYFLTFVDTRSDREATPKRLLTAYHEELTSNGVTDYTLDQLNYDRRVATFYVVWVANLAVGLLDMSSDRGLQMLAATTRSVRRLSRELDLVALAEADF
ncbi:MAG: phosphotransferase [Chloroflexi bacterium]|nr:phosphotransferase [Chloroflexota bacterium]